MGAARRVGWWVCGLLLALPSGVRGAPQPAGEASPVFLRLETGTWAIGGVEDLTGEAPLILMPTTCNQEVAVLRVGIGFVAEAQLSALDLAGTLEASEPVDLEIHLKNQRTGNCDLLRLLQAVNSSFRLEDLPFDSETYQDPESLELELCLTIRRRCGPPPTDKDAVSVQDLTIGPKGGGL
ncbi:MAG: hypothetical protein AAF657_27575 [Acidobacteriota bacterium]